MKQEQKLTISQKIKSQSIEALKRRGDALVTFLPEGGVFMGIEALEFIRARLVNPETGLPPGLNAENPEQQLSPILTPENTPDFIYQPLQHSGNILEGYMYPWLLYNFLTVISPRKIPEVARIGAAWLAANAAIVSAETGIAVEQVPDYLDIPAGVVASVIYIGVHFWSKRFIKWLTKNIKEREEELKKEHP